MTATNIHPTAIISPKSELGEGVSIGPYTLVEDHVQIGANTVIGPHVQIEKWTTIGEDCQVFFGATLGNPSKDLKYNGERSYVRIGNRNVLREYVSISRSTFEDGETVIGDDNLLMNWVNIAHDSIIGNRTIMANFATLAGHVTIEDDVRLGAYAALHQFVRVGKMAMAGGCSKIVQDIPAVRAFCWSTCPCSRSKSHRYSDITNQSVIKTFPRNICPPKESLPYFIPFWLALAACC